MPNRGMSTSTGEEIRRLIETTPDAAARGTLLVLLRIDEGLANTAGAIGRLDTSFAEHREDYEEHLAQQQKISNRAIGAWSVLCFLFVLLQGLFGWYVQHHVVGEMERIARVSEVDANRITSLEAQLTILRERK